MLDTIEGTIDKLGGAARIKRDFGITIPRNEVGQDRRFVRRLS